ncbi:DUF6599 family protein [Bacteroidota bacterium]
MMQNLLLCQNTSELPGFLPDKFGGWELQSEPEQYAGDDLFFLINGGADLFLEYGFVEVISAKYINGDNFIRIEIYKMEDHQAAFGIFTMKKYSDGSWINIGDTGSFLDSYLVFVKSKYTVIISGSDSNDDIQSRVKSAARQIDDKIDETGTLSEICGILPPMGLDPNSIKYFEGILGLNSVYIFGYTNIFGFYECITAKYDDHTLFVMGYENNTGSRNGYENALNNFKEGTKFSGFSELPDGTYFKDKNGKFISMQLLNRFIIITISDSEIDYSKIRSNVNGMIK